MGKPLWDFVRKRMNELGLSQSDLEVDHDIPYATMQRIKAGSTNFKEVTKQKLALALKCSIGDINSAIYDIQNIKPGREEGEDLSDKANESEQPAKEETPEPALKLKDKAVKRKEEKQQTVKTKPRIIKDDPPPKEKWPVDPPEEKKTPPPDYVDAAIYSATQPPDVFGIKRARREAVAEYKQKLKDICIAAYLDVPKLNITGETAAGYIGKALMKELLKDDTEAE